MPADEVIMPTTASGWRELIQDQFGQQALADFEKQKTKISSEESYYQFLVSDFKEIIEEFFKFSKIYHNENSKWRPSATSVAELTEKIKHLEQMFHDWKSSNDKTQFKTLKKYYEFYIDLIDALASQAVTDDYHISNLMFTIKHNLNRIAVSLIRSKKIDLNFCSGHNYTALIFAGENENPTVLRALLESEKLDYKAILNHAAGVESRSLYAPYHLNLSFRSMRTKEMAGMFLYYVLKNTSADAANLVLHYQIFQRYTKQDVYNYIVMLINEVTDDNVKANILRDAIGIVNGQFTTALSYYFHVIDSPNNVVKKLKDMLQDIEKRNKNLVYTSMEPAIRLKDIAHNFELSAVDLQNYYELELGEEIEWERIQEEAVARQAQLSAMLSPPIIEPPIDLVTPSLLKATGKYTLGSLAVSTLLGVTAALTLALAFDVAPIYPFVGFIATVISVFVLAMSAHMMYIKYYHPDALLPPVESVASQQYELSNSSAQHSFELDHISGTQAAPLMTPSTRPSSYTWYLRAAVSAAIKPEPKQMIVLKQI